MGCLLLLAVHSAKKKASLGNEDFTHCHSLTLPVGWRELVAGHMRILMSYEEGTSTWRCGDLLSRFGVGLGVFDGQVTSE